MEAINQRERSSHPSFGQIQFTRTNGNARFYGSELNQAHYVEMTVHPSEVERELSRDWFYTEGAPLIKVRLSQNQFAELITSLNMGSGVPCTVGKARMWVDKEILK